MVRFNKEDKKHIAIAQKQVVYEEDDWTGRRRVVGYRCKKCRRVFPLDIMEVDHIIPRSQRGGDRPSNYQLLCPPCNKKKGSKVEKPVSKTKAKARIKKTLVSKKPKRAVRRK
jgi:5-methylcytosine-specific restriction endonuclease McrA